MQYLSRSLTVITAFCCSLLFVVGCGDTSTSIDDDGTNAIKTYPVPTKGELTAELPVSHLAAKSMAASTSNLVSNGGFETNGGTNSSSFSGWTVWNQAGGSGNYYAQTGTSSPLGLFSVPAPPSGSYAAMSDQYGPGSHIIYQDVTIPSSGADLSFDLFIANRASAYYTPSTLLYNTGSNQQFRMDIMDPTATITDMGSGIWQNVHATTTSSPFVYGYTTITASLDNFAGQTVRLRFAEVDNALYFQAGIDNVQVNPKVNLDVKPGSSKNPVNTGSKGVLSVAILTESWFDATTVDVSSVTLGDGSGSGTGVVVKKNGTYQASQEDVDNDGDTDLVLKFDIQDMVSNGDLSSSSTELWVNGADTNGDTFSGFDSITIVP